MTRDGKGALVSQRSVRLKMPASSEYLRIARTATAAVCARLDYPIDRLEDIKLAVDEACSLLLADAAPDSAIELVMTPDGHGELQIEVSARTRRGRPPKQTSFAWTVLSALVDNVEASVEGGIVTIRLHATRGDMAGATRRSPVGSP